MKNRVVATGLAQPEGPVCLADGSIFLVEMDESRECLTQILDGGERRVIARPGGRPTGLAVDAGGCFWVAGGPSNSLVQLSPDGRILKTIMGDDEGAFLFPNDLAFGPNGLLYMTDSGMRPGEFIQGMAIRPDFFTARYEGCVLEIDPTAGRVLRRLASRLRFANGIAFGPDGALYANESLTGSIYRLTPLDEHCRAEVFSNVLPETHSDRFVGPDGMAFDVGGRLYCTIYGLQQVAVVDRSGQVGQRLQTNGGLPTNVAFTPGTSAMLVTEVELGALEVLQAVDPGIPLHIPRT
jgi:gluconolactonase